jgi:hypothetical protein
MGRVFSRLFFPIIFASTDVAEKKQLTAKEEGDAKGVDGLLYFHESKDERRKIIVQVKGGSVKRGEVTNRNAAMSFTI